MLVIVHWAPTTTAPVGSVTLPEIRTPSVCAKAAMRSEEELRQAPGTSSKFSLVACTQH